MTAFDLAALCAPPASAPADLADFLRGHPSAEDPDTLAAALLGGHAAPTLGFAFAAGYRAALRALAPLARGELAALCVTEPAGNAPKHLSTELVPTPDGFLLRGEKSFVTLGPLAERLLVAAVTHVDEEGRKHLALARVPVDRPGVTVEALPPLPFVPDVPHGRARFEGARVAREELLAGEGWTAYVRPFRTIEDLHVLSAVVAHGLALARTRRAAPPEAGLAAACLARALGAYAWDDPRLHLALDGLFGLARAFLSTVIAGLPDGERAAYERDARLLATAEGARRRRTEKARQALW